LAVVVVDMEFGHPRLAALYDALNPSDGDLPAYLDVVAGLAAERVLDVGCGTGRLALLLAARGCDVVAVDPAAASLAVARSKPDADRVRWRDGDATCVTLTDRDVALMTGNTAQAIVEDEHWSRTLQAIHACLRPGGHLLFETRDPAARAWQHWTRAASHRVSDVPGKGSVERWVEVTAVDWPLVRFRWTWVFASDGVRLTSTSTLRFRDRSEVVSDLDASGFDVLEVLEAPDRPGEELVFLARRREPARHRAGTAT
jgi:SAM-dependent methyltransferase